MQKLIYVALTLSLALQSKAQNALPSKRQMESNKTTVTVKDSVGPSALGKNIAFKCRTCGKTIVSGSGPHLSWDCLRPKPIIKK